MDINYILRREQQSLARAESSPSPGARAAHRAFALAYGKLLVESSYPHNRFQTDAERSRLRGVRNRLRTALAMWENEGGSIRDSLDHA